GWRIPAAVEVTAPVEFPLAPRAEPSFARLGREGAPVPTRVRRAFRSLPAQLVARGLAVGAVGFSDFWRRRYALWGKAGGSCFVPSRLRWQPAFSGLSNCG